MTNYFDSNIALTLHDEYVTKSNKEIALLGFKDRNKLESVLGLMQVDDYYPYFEDKIAYLVYATAQNHPFRDGNKRGAIILGAYFLTINGYSQDTIDNFIKEMESIVLLTVIGQLSREDLGELIGMIINNLLPYPEHFQFKLLAGLEFYQTNFSHLEG